MTDVAVHTVGDGQVQLRLVHTSAQDPLFDAARYVYSVESAEAGFELAVEFAPIFVHLLSLRDRANLVRLAERVVRDAVDAGVAEAATVRVSSDGTPRVGPMQLPALLPLA
jgi:hypothetical protein